MFDLLDEFAQFGICNTLDFASLGGDEPITSAFGPHPLLRIEGAGVTADTRLVAVRSELQ